jgi:hypothetical protein
MYQFIFFVTFIPVVVVVDSISAENNSTIIFPVPIDIISQMMGNNNNKRVNQTEANT